MERELAELRRKNRKTVVLKDSKSKEFFSDEKRSKEEGDKEERVRRHTEADVLPRSDSFKAAKSFWSSFSSKHK